MSRRPIRLYIDGVLVPAARLINGATVVRAQMRTVVYHHVKCDRHVVLVANGAAAESLLDDGDLSFFSHQSMAQDEGAPVVALHPRLPVSPISERLAAPLATKGRHHPDQGPPHGPRRERVRLHRSVASHGAGRPENRLAG